MESDKKGKPKRTRNNEKRKESSKLAAEREGRSNESKIFDDIVKCLPIDPDVSLDKLTICKLAVCELRLRSVIDGVKQIDNKESSTQKSSVEPLLKAECILADGNHNDSLLIVSVHDGMILYISQLITDLLGLNKYEAIGQNVYDMTHPCDHQDIEKLLTQYDTQQQKLQEGTFRMKCSSTSTCAKPRRHYTKSNIIPSFKVVHCTGRIFTSPLSDDKECDKSNEEWFICVCEPLLNPCDVDIPLTKQAFVTKHTGSMKFSYVDEEMQGFLGYRRRHVLEKSFYDFCHTSDLQAFQESFKSLYKKGQALTQPYRMLARNGGYVWVMTQATALYNDKESRQTISKVNSVVCIHFILSDVQEKDNIMSCVQRKRRSRKSAQLSEVDSVYSEDVIDSGDKTSDKDPSLPSINELSDSHVTTENGSSAYNDFAVEDLIQLAPVSGDAFVPISMEDFILFDEDDQQGLEYLTSNFLDTPLELLNEGQIESPSYIETVDNATLDVLQGDDILFNPINSQQLSPAGDGNLISSSNEYKLLSTEPKNKELPKHRPPKKIQVKYIPQSKSKPKINVTASLSNNTIKKQTETKRKKCENSSTSSGTDDLGTNRKKDTKKSKASILVQSLFSDSMPLANSLSVLSAYDCEVNLGNDCMNRDLLLSGNELVKALECSDSDK